MDPNSNPSYDTQLLPGDFAIGDRMFEFTKYDTNNYAWLYHMGTHTACDDYHWKYNNDPDYPAPTVAIDLTYQQPGIWNLEAKATAGPEHPEMFTPIAPQFSRLFSHNDGEFSDAAAHITTLAAQVVNTAFPISPDPELHMPSKASTNTR